ncbi:MAG: ABC transporter ATP-binding protein [Chloroflexi bacterium]|nr:MAG: ABC transporter ATP-binding protein [Chloroflexota bacterium]
MVTAQNPPLLAIRGLSATYRTGDGILPAVRDVNFDLHAGEVLALVGESAAGKTTVAQAILGLLPQQAIIEGDVRYRGASLQEMSAEELRHVRGEEIAIIFQNALASLTPTLAIGDQLAEVYRAHRGMDQHAAREAAMAVLRTVLPDPERIADAYPFQLSGGMAQRVMIAMATALHPSVIIADEPTSSLDPAVRIETLDKLEALRNEGAGVLLITHDFGVVARLADRVAVMYAGTVVEMGDVRTIFRRPRHPYTFGLLQSLPSIARRGQLVSMRGQPPDLATIGPECPFLPRCSKAISRCRVEDAPRLEPADTGVPDHSVACFNPMSIDRQEART